MAKLIDQPEIAALVQKHVARAQTAVLADHVRKIKTVSKDYLAYPEAGVIRSYTRDIVAALKAG